MQEHEDQAEHQRDNAGPFDQAGEDEHRALDRAGLLRLAGDAAQGRVADQADADADADDGQTHADAGAGSGGRIRERGDRRCEDNQKGNQTTG